jgi:hypothetical protein
MDRIRDEINEMQRAEEHILAERLENAERSRYSEVLAFWVTRALEFALVICVFVAVTSYWRADRNRMQVEAMHLTRLETELRERAKGMRSLLSEMEGICSSISNHLMMPAKSLKEAASSLSLARIAPRELEAVGRINLYADVIERVTEHVAANSFVAVLDPVFSAVDIAPMLRTALEAHQIEAKLPPELVLNADRRLCLLLAEHLANMIRSVAPGVWVRAEVTRADDQTVRVRVLSDSLDQPTIEQLLATLSIGGAPRSDPASLSMEVCRRVLNRHDGEFWVERTHPSELLLHLHCGARGR